MMSLLLFALTALMGNTAIAEGNLAIAEATQLSLFIVSLYRLYRLCVFLVSI